MEYEEALVLSKKNKKEIFVLFTGDYCSWCKKQKIVLSSDKVSEKLNDYIVCYVDVTKNKQIAKKYDVKSIPVMLIINENEEIIKSYNGYKSEKEFLNWMKN